MAVTRIKNNQITDAISANVQNGINAAAKLQNYSITSTKIANSLVYGSDLTVSGNLTVNGTTSTIDTINTLIKDPILTLADGQTSGTPTVDIGLLGLRGANNSSFIGWQETGQTFMAILSNTIASNTTVNVTSYANFTANTITAQANLSVIGNIVGTANFTGNVNAGNILTPGIMSSTGNATHGNILTGGLVSATSNVIGGNVLTVGIMSSTGNATHGNILTGGLISATGSITGGNILTGGVVSAIGNITANTGSFFIGNGSQLTGVTASTSGFPVTAGTSNIAATTNGNIGITIAGTSNVLTITSTGILTSGTSSVSGNLTVGNVLNQGLSSTVGNVIAGNVITVGQVSATANVTGGNVLTGGLISATGTITSSANITGGNILTGGLISATGNATVGNISATNHTGTTVSITGNVTSGNVNTGNISLSGNVISALNITGNTTSGNLLTPGIVSAAGNVIGGNVSTTGNVTAANVTTPVVRSSATMTISTGSGDLTLNPTGNVTMSSKNITSLADPVQDQDAATKIYVDTVAQGLDPKASVFAGTTGNLATASGGTITYNNGTAGVGANLVTTGTYLLIDGANVQTANTRVLVKNEGNATFNGIYVWSNATVLTRAADFNQPAEVPSAFTFVEAGSTNADTGWVCTTNAPVTFGTTSITFTQFSGAGSYTANTSAGISLTGSVFSALVDNNTTAFDGSGNIIVKAGANLTTPNIGNATGQSLQLNTAGGNGLLLSTTVSATGNAIAGNVLTVGIMSSTGNATAGNVLTGGLISATGNLTSGNVNTGNISLSGNVISALNVTGNITGSNVLTGGLISATANVTGGNVLTGGLVSATGNATAGNVLTGGQFSSAGNINTSANIIQTGTGNINGYNGYFANNLTVIGTFQSTGNITSNVAGIFYGNSVTGNGALYAGLPGYTVLASNVVTQFTGNANSYSQVNFQNTNTGTLASTDFILTSNNGNDTTYYADFGITSNNHADTAFFGDTQTKNDVYLYVVGNSQAGTPTSTGPGNLILGSTNGNIKMFVGNTAQANVIQTLASTGVYITGISSASGNITGGNVLTGGLVSATSNVTGGNILTVGIMSSTGNATAGNVLTGGLVSATGNGTFGNIVLTGNNINQLQVNSGINVNGAQANTNTAIYGQNNANAVFFVNASTNTASFGSSAQTTNAVVAFNATNSVLLPVGTLGQRPSTGVTGMTRFNSTNNALEIYNNSEWAAVGGTTYTVIADEQFNGDGANVAFTLGSTQTTNSCIVSINGVLQIPGSAYSVAGTNPTCVLTFTEAPALGDLIDVREITSTTTVTAISNNSGNATITGNIGAAQMDVLGNLVPTANVTYSLGSSTNYWKSLYVGGNTIYLGGLQLQSAAGNVFQVFASDGTTPATFSTAGNITAGNIVNSNANGVGNIGSSTNYFNTVFAKATSAQYADLAEKYVADATYVAGTVLSFGGSKEVTKSNKDADRAVAGVVSTNPSYIMNATLEAEYVATIALTGRVPTSVTGTVVKGDLMVSNGDGTARADADPKAGAIIGKALENFAGDTGVIEVVIGRF